MALTKLTNPDLFDFSDLNTALQLPTGDTASRPGSPSTGEWRYNTDEKYVEFWDGSAWRQIDTEALPNPDEFPSEHFSVNTYTGTGTTQTIDAKFVEAANFNGSSSVITLPSSVNQSNNFSWSCWVYFNSLTDYDTLIGLQDIYRNYLDILANGTVGFFDGNQLSSPSGTITTSTWYNIVITKNSTLAGGKARIMYVNGTEVASDTTTTSSISGTGSGLNLIGAYNSVGSTSAYLDGKIDQVRFFNTALTPAQAEDCYTDETTTTAATLNFPAGAGCIAAYQLDGDASDLSGTYGGVTTDIGYTGLKFQPDFVWIKARNGTGQPTLFDSIRGVEYYLETNSTADEQYYPGYGLTAFGTTSFSVSDIANGGYRVNGASGGLYSGTPPDYVAWCWKAGGAPTATNSAGAGVAPTPGSVMIDGVSSTAALAGNVQAEKMSVNTAAQFSIVNFISQTGSTNQVPHGLNGVPDLFIFKRTDSSESWWTYTQVIDGSLDYFTLNTDDLKSDATETAPTATTVYQPTSSSGRDYILYCFKNVDGYQRVSTYLGSGSAAGNYVYTTDDGTATGANGFEPAFLMIKKSDGTGDWMIIDNKRSPANPRAHELFPNEDDVENDLIAVDFYTNGFELVTTDVDYNESAKTYLYLAIAANKDSSVPTLANSFNATLFTPTNTSDPLSVYADFKPDFVWSKYLGSTPSVTSHYLVDSQRGLSSLMYSDRTDAAYTASYYVKSFDPNGITYINNLFNRTGTDTAVAWFWKAGGLGTINNDGATTSVVSANAEAGFSIVKYVGPAGNSTVGHGLGAPPRMVIQKQYTASTDWYVYFPENVIDANLNYMELNDTVGITSTTSTNPNSTIINTAASGPIVAYCFADVTNYMKIDTYSGSGVSGKQITGLGFTPKFVMIKRVNNTDAFSSWYMFDNVRLNGIYSDQLEANTNAAESSVTYVSFFSGSGGGFQLDTTASNLNNSGSEFVYIAIG